MFPPVIDSSMRSEFVACPHRFYRRHIQGFTHDGDKSIHLHFGGCFAAGLEAFRRAFYDGLQDTDAALIVGTRTIIHKWGARPPESFPTNKTLEKCIGALESFVAQYPPATDHCMPARSPTGGLMLEFNAAVPLPISHPDTGEPILYAGRFDQVCNYMGLLMGEDDKTTSQLGASWSAHWRMRGQFTGYCWLAREFGLPLQGFVVRGISILKNSFGHAEVIEQRPDWMLSKWHTQLLYDIRHMIECYQAGFWSQNLDHACADFGGCAFLPLCSSATPERWESNYVVKHYNPLEKPE